MADRVRATTARHRGVEFFGSKPGDVMLNNYNYTDNPTKLLFSDLYYVFWYARSLPLVLLPLRPRDGNKFDELAWGWKNAYCVVVHAILIVMQLGFVICIPLMIIPPPFVTAGFVAAFLVVNFLLSWTLNGWETEHVSHREYTEGREAHDDEMWLYINGIATGDHWLQSNLNRLALTFGRPVRGIHNPTYGIIFDLLECIVQRTFGYATRDIRRCYKKVKEALLDEKNKKVVFILHSQGGIEGSAIIDWLLQELPQNLLSKLEVYTFGNATNHFNNPFRNDAAKAQADRKPLAAAVDAALGPTAGAAPSASKPAEGGKPQQSRNEPPLTPPTPLSPSPMISTLPASPGALAGLETGSRNPVALSGNAIGHIEHYCHATDFVAQWGILHFKSRSLEDPPRAPPFAGRAFSRTGAPGDEGHLLCQHYLNAMFPLERDGRTGKPVRCAETNDFMEAEVTVRGRGWGGGDNADDDGQPPGSPGMLGREGAETMTRKVKELSRLWQYRNGKSPGVNA